MGPARARVLLCWRFAIQARHELARAENSYGQIGAKPGKLLVARAEDRGLTAERRGQHQVILGVGGHPINVDSQLGERGIRAEQGEDRRRFLAWKSAGKAPDRTGEFGGQDVRIKRDPSHRAVAASSTAARLRAMKRSVSASSSSAGTSLKASRTRSITAKRSSCSRSSWANRCRSSAEMMAATGMPLFSTSTRVSFR